MKWISVKDRLPLLGQVVLCIKVSEEFPDCYMWYLGELEYENGPWIDQEYKPISLTHWMPLPPPPKGT